VVANKWRSGVVEREDGGRQVAGRGEERCTGAVAVDHTALARRTRQRVVSGGGETGKQAAVLEQRSHEGASRGDAGMESWFENGWKNSGDSRRR
jgi:hypothetical protein